MAVRAQREIADDELTCQIRRLILGTGEIPTNWKRFKVHSITDEGQNLCGSRGIRPTAGAGDEFLESSSDGVQLREQITLFPPGRATLYLAATKDACAKEPATSGSDGTQGHTSILEPARGDESLAFTTSLETVNEYDFMVRYGDLVSTIVYVRVGARLADAESFAKSADAKIVGLLPSLEMQSATK